MPPHWQSNGVAAAVATPPAALVEGLVSLRQELAALTQQVVALVAASHSVSDSESKDGFREYSIQYSTKATMKKEVNKVILV
ncbi:hypothetical protein TIFTF001_024368 [Ficus carica]|uniref:Uncharacterized protein n=1 Tax=Ficus carica TaxID=3494 RepID=A0AA88DG07_FICCA|nr:hypothetical protein TIFTF001_024368 [Ficus carica]